MNKKRKLLDILQKGYQEFGFIGTKAEFEAEGTRRNELTELAILTAKADLELTIKIGGCEAVSDLQDAKIYGASNIVAPMVESDYALKKYIEATNRVFTKQELGEINLLYNLETIHAFNERQSILNMTRCGHIDGIVFGRVDYCYSKNEDRNSINSEKTTRDILTIAELAKENDLILTVGGGINEDSVQYLQKLREIRLDRFESRKIVFDSRILNEQKINEALSLAFEFELLWLENKSDQYKQIAKEDSVRIEMLRQRFSLLKD
jgi:hypothetical protein